MKLIRVSAAAINQTPLDWMGNLRNMESAIQKARGLGASVVCLPELCISGYGCEDAFHAPGLHETAWRIMEGLLPATSGMIVSVGLPIMYAGGVFNAAALLVNGQLAGLVPKQHLAGDGIHYEPRWFKSWPELIHSQITVSGRSVPIGDICFDVGGIKIGFEICEDAWVGTRPGSRLAARGVDLILNPSASHFAFGKHGVRSRFVLEGSRAFHVSYVYSNLLGNESGRAIFDGDTLIASAGVMLAVGPRLSFQPVSVTAATVDVESTRMSRARTSSFRPEVDGDESDVIAVDFDWPAIRPDSSTPVEGKDKTDDTGEFEDFTRAVSLGLFDYLRKSRSQGFVISLSGGVDSAAASVLVWTMVELGIRELGAEEFVNRAGLNHVEGTDSRSLMKRILTTAYQSTRNSGKVTRQAAADVARAIGCNHLELDVNGLVEDYQSMIERAIGRELEWNTDDITLQNIQSRVRAPGVWMLANLGNALLLSTSNRSEAAVGYATMDGDTAGGLSPLAGIDKAFLRRWLRWMESIGPYQLKALPELGAVNSQQPTAELRPLSAGQTDEDDLMPYEVLDRVEQLGIRDKLMPINVLARMEVEFTAFERRQLAAWIIRFFRLWSRNQWKRERYAPSFHLDDENLDPKTWCRFPILSGGYEYELTELTRIAEEG